MKKAAAFLLSGLILCTCLTSVAQPFFNEVTAFQKLDSANPPVGRPILFIGSSSFTRWRGLSQAFPDKPVLNRAFGGSSLTDQLYYAESVIFKYNPKQIVLYCGENDLASNDQVNADSVFNRYKRLVDLIRSRLPKVPVLYVSMKPSPSREKLLGLFQEANKKIAQYAKKRKGLFYLDVYTPMLLENGKMRNDIYVSDNLHMNEKGYAIWQPLIQARLLN